MSTSPGGFGRRSFLFGATATAAAVLAGCASGDGENATSSASSAEVATSTTGETSSTSSSRRDATTTASADADSTTASTADDAAEPAEFVVRGSGDEDVVALTFHTNGDLSLAQQLVDVLAEHDAVATCFIVGNWLADNPSWAEELAGAGLELANHTWSHPTFASLSAGQMADEIGRCRDTLVELTGDAGRFFRPSGTDDGTSTPATSILVASGEAGYSTVLGWDVEPYDYKDPGAAAVEQAVLRDVTAGSIVSLHFGHPGTITALDPILRGLGSRGLRTVTASELLGA